MVSPLERISCESLLSKSAVSMVLNGVSLHARRTPLIWILWSFDSCVRAVPPIFTEKTHHTLSVAHCMSFLSVLLRLFLFGFSRFFCFVLVFLFDRVFITVFGQNQNWSKHGCRLTFVMGFRLGWQHCPIKFLGYFLTDLKFVLVTASNFCLFLFDFCYF